MDLSELGGWPAILQRLAAGEHLAAVETGAALTEILQGQATPSQLAAFIFGLRCKGETVEELTGLVQAMLSAAESIAIPDDLRHRLIDTCGTGGDRQGTVNVSTMAAFVVAGAGVPVCKHANRSASLPTGSVDLLEALGVKVDLGPIGVADCLQEVGLAFCFAQRFHPSLRHAGPTRREGCGVPTAFNFIGPLANPARVKRQVVGVSDPGMAERMLAVLQANGAERTLIVHGHDGLDELSTTGPSTVHEFSAGPSGGRRTWIVDPVQLGLPTRTLDELRGGDVTANAAIARRVLGGERGAHREIVLLNAAAGLLVAGAVGELSEGLEAAGASVDGGQAQAALDKLVALTAGLPPGT